MQSINSKQGVPTTFESEGEGGLGGFNMHHRSVREGGNDLGVNSPVERVGGGQL